MNLSAANTVLPRRFKFLLFLVCFVMAISSRAQLGLTANGKALNNGDSITICINSAINYVSTTTGSPKVKWRFNNGIPKTSILASQTVAYNSLSRDTTWLITTSGVIDSMFVVIRVSDIKPTTSFTFTPNGQCGSVPINFISTSTGTGLSYAWNFGDVNSLANNTSTDVNPTHKFVGTTGNSTQTFAVSLTVTNVDGCSATATQTVVVKQLPGTLLGGDGYLIYTDGLPYFTLCNSTASTFTFSNKSTTSLTNLSYTIIWGDNSPNYNVTSFSTTTHLYNVGIYSLQFIVNGSNGCSDTGNYKVFVGGNPSVGFGLQANTDICTNNQLTFYISQTENNPVGTTYTVSFNDPNNNFTYQPPVPDSISHTFLISSCGYTSPGSNGTNSFYAKIVASNPCGVKEGNVLPIHVSQKPIPSIKISPKDTVCVNLPVTFTNNSIAINNVSTSGVCTLGQVVWQISPSTGWTVTSGSLGDDFNSNSPSVWNGGSNTPIVVFNTPGTYTIKFKLGGNTKCGVDSTSKTICVNPAPISAFTIDNATGCTPMTVTTTNNSNTPNCGINTYTWSVAYSSTGCIPNISNYVYTNGTDSSSAAPQFRFTNPGTYVISLVTKSSGGACTSLAVTKTVIVKSKPTASISAALTVCQNASITPTATVNNCYATTGPTYSWSFPHGTPSSSTLLVPGIIVYNTAGPDTMSLTITNECGSTTVTKPIFVNPIPDVILPPNQTFCKGVVTAQLPVSSTVAGTTFSWKNSNTAIGSLAASGTGNIPSFTTNNTGSTPIIGTITVTPTSNGCSGIASTFTITINPLPASLSNATVSYCQNDIAVPLTATVATGDTLIWYTVATGGVGSRIAPTPSTAAVGNTNYYVTQINAAGCESPTRATITVTVNQIPTLTNAIGTNPITCAASNGSILLTGLPFSTALTLTYTKDGTLVSTTINSSGTGTFTIAALGAATYDNIKVTRLGCSSNAMGPISLSDPNPPATPTATSNSPICSGATLTLNTNAIAGATYIWSGPNLFSSANQNPSIINATTAASGNYSITVKVNGCTSAAGIVPVVVNQTPVITASGTSPICSGDTLRLTASSTTPGTIAYAWTGPNSFTDTLATTFIPNATTLADGIYSVTGTLGNCPATKTVTIKVNPTPNIASTTVSNPATCSSSTGSISLMGLGNSIAYTVNYLSNGVPVTKPITSGTSGVLIIPGLAAGTYSNITVTSLNCPSKPVGPFVLVDPTPPTTPTATSNSPVCSGATLNLFATTIANGTYTWTGPSNFTTQNPTIPNATIAASGTYRVTVKVNGCTSASDSVNVVVNPTPIITASGASPICSGDTLRLTASSTTTGTITYAWTGPNGFTDTLPTTFIPNATTLANGVYSVIGTLGSCPATQTVTIKVNPTPQITDSNHTDPINCSSPTGTITLNGLANSTSYSINYLKNGTPITATVASNTIGAITILGLTSGTYSNITLTSTGCTSRAIGPFVLADPTPPATPIAKSNSPVCSGNAINLTSSTSTTGTVTYNWTGPNSFASKNQNPTILNASIAAAGNYSVVATINGCSSLAGTVTVVVAPNVTIANAGTAQQLCNTSTTTLAGNSAGSGTGTWTVIAPSTAVVAQPNSPTSIINNLPVGTTRVAWTITNNVCQPTSDTVQIVNLPALVNTVSPQNNIICTGQSIAITGALPLGGSGTYTYQWQQSADNVLFTNITGATAISLSISPTTTTYYRRNIVSGACAGMSDTAVVTVLGAIGNNIISADQAICINTTPTNIAGALPTGGGGAYTYSWEQSTDSGATWQLITGATAQNYQPGVLTVRTMYRRNVITASCGGSQASVSNVATIKINPNAKALFNPTTIKGCAPFSITPAIINLTPYPANNSQYNWYVNGNLIGSGQNFPGYTMTNTGDSITIKLVAISLFGCKNDSMQVGFKTVVRPVPAFSQSDSVGCGPLHITFTNNTPNVANYAYQWDFGTGQTSTLAQPGLIDFPTNPNYGDTVYAVKFKTISQCDTITLTSYVRVRAKPKALFTPNKTVGCSPMVVIFSNTTRGTNLLPFVWDFGDGSAPITSTAATVQHTYNVGKRDTFKIKLIATNDCGRDSLVYAIIVQPNTIRLDFGINGSDRYGCLPHTVAFINNTSGANAFTWDFGDGSTLLNTTRGVDTIYHTYTTAGNFTTTLKAANSCSDTSDVELVTVYTRPKASITAYPLAACIGDSIQFTNLSDTGVSNLWRFGDGTTSFNRNPAKAYTAPFTYLVKYFASRVYANGTVCADSSSLNILIRDTLPGSFLISDTVGSCPPFTTRVKYTGGSSVETKWNFGDGTIIFGDSVSHTYTTPGVYVINMYVRSAGGCVTRASKVVTVSGPTGTLTYPLGYTCVGTSIRFQTNSTSAGQFKFYFGDGDSLLTTVSPVFHAYTKPGVYVPSLLLITGTCQSKINGVDTIRVDQVKAGFSTGTTANCANTAIQFTDTSYSYFGMASYNWNFGDGSATSSLKNPSHNYSSSGTYNVRLRVTGISGCTDTLQLPIVLNVHNVPASSIGGDTVACVGQPLALIANVQSTDTVQSRNWNFGNGVLGSGTLVNAVYGIPGSYQVRLTSRTNFGCADTVYKVVRAKVSPIVFAGNDVTICKGQSIQIAATGASSYNWYPTQGLSCATCASPIASPNFTTNYSVVGANGVGCSASDTITVNVVQPFAMVVTPATDTLCVGDRVQLSATNAYSYIWNPATGLDNSQVPNPVASPSYTTRYRVIGFDAFNCFTDTGFVVVAVGQYPVVDFGSTGATVIAGTVIQLSPSITNGPIRYYRWTPTHDLSCTSCGNPIVTINTDVTYILQVENNYGCTGSDTISYKVNCDPSQVFIPNAFSPDGDGINDVLMVRAKGVAQVKYFRIFDRWGQLVFERNNISANDPGQGWNGKINEKYANPDVYVYTAEVICTAGGTFVYKGNVTLVR